MDSDKRYTSIHAVKILVIAMAISFAASLFAELIKDPNIKTLVSVLITQICYLAVPFIILKKEKFPYKEVIPQDIGVYPLGVLLTIPIAVAALAQNLMLTVSFMWLADAMNLGFYIVLDVSNPVVAVFGVLIIGILPAISEEIMFRGVIMSSLRERGLWYPVFVSAAVFALAHMNIKQLVHPFLLGVILAYITIKTGNIIYAMCIHFLNNFMALFIDQIPFFANLMVYSPKNFGILCGIMAAGAAVLYPSIWLFLKATKSSLRFKKYSETSPYEKASEKPMHAVNKPILYICIIFVVLMILTALASYFQNKA